MNEIDFTRFDKKVDELCDEDAAEVCAQFAARNNLKAESIFFADMRRGARTLMRHCLLHEVKAENPDQREAWANCPALRILQAEAMALAEIRGFRRVLFVQERCFIRFQTERLRQSLCVKPHDDAVFARGQFRGEGVATLEGFPIDPCLGD